MSTVDKFSTLFHQVSLGTYSAHEVALDGFADYEDAITRLVACALGDTIEDDFGEFWERIA